MGREMLVFGEASTHFFCPMSVFMKKRVGLEKFS